MAVDLVVHNGTVVTPEGRIVGAGVAIEDGTIVSLGQDAHLPLESAARVVDADGLILVPGLIDAHIHNRAPGLEYKEDWETATRAAAAGGITMVVGMPNTDPIIDRPSALERKFSTAATKALVDYQSYAVITAENIDQIPALASAGALGFKIFLGSTVGDIPPPTDGEILEAMAAVSATGRRLGFHEENGEIVAHSEAAIRAEGREEPIDHAHSRPVIAEREAIDRMVTFAGETDARVHMFHVSSGSAAAAVARGKDQGVDVTAETTPHYLWFDESALLDHGNVAKVNPPLRPTEEQERLWSVGIEGGAIDMIATDHAPHTDEEKLVHDPFGPTWDAQSGFVGLETAVPAMLTFVNDGRLSLEEWVSMHARRPAQIWDIYPQKGSLQIGTDADVTIFDPTAEWTLADRTALHSKQTVTPFEGEHFVGKPTMTIVRGEIVYADGSVVGEPGTGERVVLS